MTLVPSDIDAYKGVANIYDLDATGDLDPGDQIWFTAKHRTSDTDAEAVITKTRNAGIVDLDTPTGKFQVQLTPADTSGLTVRALLYEVKLKKADQNQIHPIAHGVMRLIEQVNKDAS